MAQNPILIVGAGPTGLVLALRLAAHGVSFRIIEKNPGPGLASRAMALHARTLEFYDQLGFADEIVGLGLKVETIHLRNTGREVAELNLNDMGKGLSPYPYMLGFPQDDHEKFLVGKLEQRGIKVEWNTTLVNFTQNDAAVHVVIDREGTEESFTASYVCGCDGARSRVREVLGLGFSGGTYNHLYYVADVKLDGINATDGFVNVNAKGFALAMPVRSSGMTRLIGIMPDRPDSAPKPTFEDVRPISEPLLGVKVKEVNWFSTYHAHHRVAEHFQKGRCFILGDAGHIHSPTGGQGMNTGIGDAVNLSWKLAHVVQGRARPSLLDTFESERIAFAHTLISTTDRAFNVIVSPNMDGRIFRGFILPRVLPILTKFPAMRRLIFKAVSQIQIAYRQSEISSGKAGHISAGDRLPWVPESALENYHPLRSMDWQVHVYGQAESDLQKICDRLQIELYVFPWSVLAQERQILKDSCFLVRPDGYIALASIISFTQKLETYAAEKKFEFGSSADYAPRTWA